MKIDKVIVLSGRKDQPEPGLVTVDTRVNEHDARCTVRFKSYGLEYIQQDFPLNCEANVWWAVKHVMYRLEQGDAISFPLDITAEVAKGPWPSDD